MWDATPEITRAVTQEEHGILPDSLPFRVIDSVAYFDSVDSHDAASDADPDNGKFWKKMVRVELDFDGVPFDMGSYSLVELATKRLTLTYELGDDQSGEPERLVARLGGVETAVPITASSVTINGVTVDVGYPFTMTLTMDGAPATQSGQDDGTITGTYSDLVVGGYYVIGTGGDGSNWSQVHRAADELLAASEQYPILNDASDTPYVDENANGGIDTGEVALLDHPEAMDALTGGLLYTAMTGYMTRFRDTLRRLDRLHHVISPIDGFLGVVSAVYEVEYLDGTAFSVMPGGLLIDMKGMRFNGNWRIGAPDTVANRHFELVGHACSSLEHEIWQQITGFDAVSTVRGIQMALANNDATLLNPKKNATENTLAETYSGFGFDIGSAPSPFGLREREIFSTEPVSWTHSEDYQYLDLMKADVDSGTDDVRLDWVIYRYYTANSSPEAWFGCVDYQEDLLESYIAQGYGNYTFTSAFQLCDGTTLSASATVSQVLAAVGEHYLDTVIPNYIGENYLTYFDKAQGFEPDQYIYRDNAVSDGHHSTGFLRGIRDNVSLFDPDYRLEYVLPSRKTSGSYYRFLVYIAKLYESDTDALVSQSFLIGNESVTAGGGYVDGEEALDESLDTTGVLFNNEIFTDQNFNALANNDLVRTPSTADPVSTVTGNMYHDETDIAIKGRGIDYLFTRTYNSAPSSPDTVGTPLGFGWSHAYDMQLVANDYGRYPNYGADLAPENANGATSSITYTDERGGERNYLVDDLGGTWAVTAPQGYFDSLALDTPTAGQHTLTFRSGVQYLFDAQGIGQESTDIRVPGTRARLLAIQDPHGNRLDLHYDAGGQLIQVVDNLGLDGRTGLTFAYNTGGRIGQISDWTGRTWSYQYDTDGNLIRMDAPEGLASVDYSYHPGSHLLQTITQPELRDGQPVTMTFAYYHNDKAFNYVDTLGHTETLDYDLYGKRTRVTDPRGGVREYSYDQNGALIKLTEPDGAILAFQNTQEGLRYGKTGGTGYRTFYSYRTDRSIGDGESDTGGQLSLEQDPLGHTIEYDYGIYGQPTRIQDKNANQRYITYYDTSDDASGALAGKKQHIQTELDGNLVTLETWTWNPGGTPRRRIQYIDTAGTRQRYTDYTYDASGLGLLEVRIGATGTDDEFITTYTYDGLGRKLTQTTSRRASATDPTPVELTTGYEYDALGRPVRITDPVGTIAETVYDLNGKVSQQKVHYKLSGDPLTYDTRIVATHTYDAAGRRISTTDVDGNTTRFAYDPMGNLIEVTDANGHITQYEVDPMGRRTAIIDANGYRTETAYDLAGNVVRVTDPNGNATGFEVDALGRRTITTSPLGNQTRMAYDGNGNLTHLTDANAAAGAQPVNGEGASVFHQYGQLGRRVRTLDAQDGETLYQYDLTGNLTALTDPEGRVTTFVYDDLGRLVETIDPLVESPDDRTVTFTHDELGNVLTRTDREGQITHYTYDLANRLVLTEYLTDDGTDTWESREYDPYGNLITLANPEVTYTYSYDNHNRLTAKTDTRQIGQESVSRSLQFTYDPVGNLTQKTDYQSEVTTLQYDSTNRLVALTNQGYLQVTYHYDGAGRLLDRILSNGVKTRYAYDADGHLVELTNTTANGTVIHAQHFGHDNIGNITAITNQDGQTTTYGYDSLYRLVTVDAPDTGNDRAYTYDRAGNRLTRVTSTDTLVYLHDAGNRLQEIRQGSDTGALVASYQYDHNGSRTERRDGAGDLVQSYQYDPKRRIAQITQGEDVHDYAYDPNDYRIRKLTPQGTHHYLLQAEHLEAIYDDDDRIEAKYLRGVVVDEIVNGYQYPTPGDEKTRENLTFHHNHNKSVTGLSAHEGSTLETLAYHAFGEIAATTGDSGNHLRYTGREQDPDTALYYYRARYYDPEVGRFLTEDPMGFKAGINFYAYVENNPVNATDSTGMVVQHLIGGVVNAAAGAAINLLSKTEITKETIAIDFATGMAGVGIASKFARLSKLAQIGLGSAAGSGLFVVGETAKNTAVILDSGLDFNFENVTQDISLGEIAANGLLHLPFSNVGTNFAANLPTIRTNAFEQTATKIGFQTPVNLAKGFASNQAGDMIDSYIPSLSSASGGFVLYPSKPNTNMLQGIYRK
ncbi:MAG: RHS repeat-associated core domain-containing protein [Candidatus Kentron sp. G]|nr:MAG: RHS repeat-associated core domain-containing protein [Candidatus Kentron sp. G]VFM98335.1 MAG: RHS repeat-associated core domain-containing protein [Candidatus Kentron sp. G]